MKRNSLLILGLLLFHHSFSQITSSDRQRAEALLKQMTVDEKIGQMTQVTMAVVATRAGVTRMAIWIRPH